MKYADLKPLARKIYFTIADLAALLQVKPASARVLATRYIKKGLFVRIKNDFYVLDQAWERLEREDYFRLANFLQVPSYVSLLSALSWHEVTTQVPQARVESVLLRRSGEFEARGVSFRFYIIQKPRYFDFVRKNGFFIATREKAFVDTVYLCSLGRYKADFAAMDCGKLDKGRLLRIMKPFPPRVREAVKKLCKI